MLQRLRPAQAPLFVCKSAQIECYKGGKRGCIVVPFAPADFMITLIASYLDQKCTARDCAPPSRLRAFTFSLLRYTLHISRKR